MLQNYWLFVKSISNTCAQYKCNISTIRLKTIKSFYQVEELGKGVSEDGAWGQVTRAERWEGHLKMDYNTAISCCY